MKEQIHSTIFDRNHQRWQYTSTKNLESHYHYLSTLPSKNRVGTLATSLMSAAGAFIVSTLAGAEEMWCYDVYQQAPELMKNNPLFWTMTVLGGGILLGSLCFLHKAIQAHTEFDHTSQLNKYKKSVKKELAFRQITI